MEKTITIGNKNIVLRAVAGVLIIYKEQFGTEYVEDMASIADDVEKAVTVGGQLIWAMAKAADDKILPPKEFYDDIGSFDLDTAFREAADLFELSCANIDTSNASGNDTLTSENLVTSALLCKMSYDELCRMSLSMALNIISQYSAIRSGEGITRMATQADFDSF